ncbi:MAG: polysaccharide pyruvyl transferase CsaB [Synechococcus sp.]
MRVVVVGYYGFGNSGDEALLLTLLQQLPAEAQPVVLSNDPVYTAEKYGIEARDRWDLRQLSGLFSNADAFVWGGGSLLQDSSSWRNPLYYGGLMQLAQWSGLATIAWAQGIGPLQRGWTRWLAKKCLKGCTAVSVRDRSSSQLLSQWNVPHTLAPDPVWGLEGAPFQPCWSTPAIAVVIRQHPLLTAERLKVLQQALDIFHTSTSAHLLLVPFQDTDIELSDRLAGMLTCPSQLVRIPDPRQLKTAFASVELTIAMRLHGLILAAAGGRAVFGLSYDPKVTRLLVEEGMPGCELGELPTDARQLAAAWLEHYQQPGLSPEHLQQLRDRAKQHAEGLRQGLGL